MIRFAIACAMALSAPMALAQEGPASNEEAAPSPFDIYYQDVATARAQVTGLSNARVLEAKDGRLLVYTAKDDTLLEYWQFVAPSDPAFPAVVRRRLHREPTGVINLQRSILCEAATAMCDEWKQRLAAEDAKLSQQLSAEAIERARQDRRLNRRLKEAARNNYGR